MKKVYTPEEIAQVLLQIVHSDKPQNFHSTGIVDTEYFGQGQYVIHVESDTLRRVAGELNEN